MKLGSEKLNNMSQRSHAGFSGGSVVRNPPINAGDPGSVPGPERSFGEGNGNPLRYSCLGNPMTEEEEPGGLLSMGLQKSWT